MALPKYDKSKRRTSFEQLPKGAYVVKIIGAREDPNKNGSGSHLSIAFDIAEGKYKDFYMFQHERNTNEDKKWSNDGMFYLTVPQDNSPQYVLDNWNTFFADLEDSNSGFVFSGDPKQLKGKLIGGKFHIEQTEYNGNIYDHVRMRWTCIADDVRSGNVGRMPNDKLITSARPAPSSSPSLDGFLSIPADTDEEELPF